MQYWKNVVNVQEAGWSNWQIFCPLQTNKTSLTPRLWLKAGNFVITSIAKTLGE